MPESHAGLPYFTKHFFFLLVEHILFPFQCAKRKHSDDTVQQCSHREIMLQDEGKIKKKVLQTGNTWTVEVVPRGQKIQFVNFNAKKLHLIKHMYI